MWMRDASAQCAQIFVRQIKSFHLHVHRELGFRQEIDSEIYIVLFFSLFGRSIHISRSVVAVLFHAKNVRKIPKETSLIRWNNTVCLNEYWERTVFIAITITITIPIRIFLNNTIAHCMRYANNKNHFRLFENLSHALIARQWNAKSKHEPCIY